MFIPESGSKLKNSWNISGEESFIRYFIYYCRFSVKIIIKEQLKRHLLRYTFQGLPTDRSVLFPNSYINP